MLDQSDARRLEALHAMFARYGYSEIEAETRARVLYYMQIGYDLAQLNEPIELRLSMVPHYLYAFTGIEPKSEEVEEFSAYSLRFWKGNQT